MKYKERDELVSGLRDLADFIEEKGLDLPIKLPRLNLVNYIEDSWDKSYNAVPGSAREKMRRAAIACGKAEKKWDRYSLELIKEFGEHVKLTFRTNREQVCEKKVVGFKDIPEQVIEARREEIVEWECRDSLLA